MDDTLEAESFCRELDKLLSGQAAEGGSEDLIKDLELAARLSRFDLSGESRVRRSLRAELISRQGRGLFMPLRNWLTARPMLRRAAYAGLAMLLLGPLLLNELTSPPKDRGQRGSEGWDIKPGSSFGGGSSPHDRGVDGMAPGSLYYMRLPAMPKGKGNGDGGSMEALKKAAARAADSMNLGAPAASSAEQASSMAMGMGYAQKYRELLARTPDSAAPASSGSQNKDSASIGESLEFLRRRANVVRGKRQLLAAAPAQAVAGEMTITAPRIRSALRDKSEVEFNREGYDNIVENAFQKAADQPLSTFSIDVDAASYANVRRFLTGSRMPPKDAVRIEELINYFRYDYPEPTGEHPFSITTELADCPWKAEHKLVRIGLKGRSIATAALPPNNLVFLIDSSGSMMEPEKLPLVKSSLRLLVDQLREQDSIAIVTYAGAAGLVLRPTSGDKKAEILAAIEGLEAGGSTAGGAGIQLAYQVAERGFLKKGNNRVILATDGDFNVGVTSDGELIGLIEEKRKGGVFLTVLGFGRGNYQDAKMEKLADKGNGNYAYVDGILEARKILVAEMGATLLAIAKDVKLQVEFNPARVSAYRLIGYENRMLAAQDFNDDKKDAGELGSGHTVTALYEVIPVGVKADLPAIDELKYQKKTPAAASDGAELLTVKFRYKKPDGEKSLLLSKVLVDRSAAWAEASPDFKFAASVAGFGMLLRGSEHAGSLTYGKIAQTARENAGKDEGGYRAEFLGLVERARLLDQAQK